MAFIGKRIALFLAQAGSALDEVHLLICVVVGQLIIIRVVQCFRERVTDVVLIADFIDMRFAMSHTDKKPVIPGLGGGLNQRNIVRDARDGIGNCAGNVISWATEVRRS